MNKQDKKQLTPRHRNCLLHQCCFWVYHLIVIGLACAILAKIIGAYHITQNIINSNQLIHSKQTVELWKKGYIVDIKSVNTNNCPQGYTPLLEYTWAGTGDGCFCSASVADYTVQYILNGRCTSELISEGCKQISALEQQKLQMWKGGKLICLKRAESLSFYDSLLQKTDSGSLMKKCSQNKTYQVNILQNVSCPISQIANTSLTASATVLLLDSANNQKLYYVNQNGYPIADFKVTEYSFCQFLNDTNISPNKIGNYKLQIVKQKPCIGQDTRYFDFDKMNEEEFFTNNTRVYDKISSLPGYPRPSTNYVYKVGYIRYPEWTYSCRASASHNLLQATEHLLFTKQKYIIEVMVSVAIPCILVFSILFRIFFIIRHVIEMKTKMMYNAVFLTDQEIVQQLPNLNIHRKTCKQVIIFLFEQLLKIAVFVVVIFALLTMFETSVWTKEAFRFKCTETYVDKILRFYQDQSDKISQILVEVCFIWSALFIIDCMYLIIRFKYTDLNQKIQVVEQEMFDSSEQLDPVKVQAKELEMGERDNLRAQDSSDIILPKDKQLIVRDIDDFMADDGIYGAGQTKDNFFGDLQNSDYNLVSTKKKKRKVTNKRKKNLFKQQN